MSVRPYAASVFARPHELALAVYICVHEVV